MKTIVLFDMDGTLTEPRREIDEDLLRPLKELSRKAEIGILTGSDINYVQQQLSVLISDKTIRCKVHLLPCNGTKHLIPPQNIDGEYELVYKSEMRRILDDSSYRELMLILFKQQLDIGYLNVPLSGHFFNYRGSMINWCPIGRDASPVDRARFIDYDTSFKPSLREKQLSRIKHYFSLRGLSSELTCALGGDTSIDIYPIGWDKTFAMRHFRDYDVWFVGDRCEDNGNDKTIYDLLKKKNRSFKTTGPKETKKIINVLINEIK